MRRTAAAAVIDAALASLLVSVAVAAAGAWQQGYFRSGLRLLPFLELADRVPAVLLPALLLAAWTAATAGILRAHRVRGWLTALLVVLAAAAAAPVGWAACSRVVLSRFGPTGWLEPLAVASVRFGPWGWTAVGVLVAALALLRPPHVLSRAARVARRAVVVAGASAGFVLASVVGALVVRPHSPSHPNVLLVVVDTVSARHMAPFGYPRVTTPELDALSSRGIRFSQAFAPSPWTLPSHASVFTGFASVRHRATQETTRLDARFDTLAEILRDAGYRTFAATGNPVVGFDTGLVQGFAEVVETWRPGVAARHERTGRHAVVGALEGFLDRRSRRAPFLAFLNFLEAHAPYQPPASAAARFLPAGSDPASALAIDQSWQRYYTGRNTLSREQLDRLNDLYDAELAVVSRAVGDLVSVLEVRGLLDDTLVVVASDHGENLGDHGHLDHVFSLHDTLLHVPLVIFGAGTSRGVTVDHPVVLTELFSTILSATGTSLPHGVARSDLRAVAGLGRAARVPLIAEYYFPLQALSTFDPRLLESDGRRLAPFLRRIRAVRDGGWKLIWASDGRHELYRVETDPDETTDLAAARPDVVRRMTALLEESLSKLAGRPFSLAGEPRPAGNGGIEPTDAGTRERLKSLGYVR